MFWSWQKKETQKNNVVVSLDYFKNNMRDVRQYDRDDLLMRKASSLLEMRFIKTTLCVLCSTLYLTAAEYWLWLLLFFFFQWTNILYKKQDLELHGSLIWAILTTCFKDKHVKSYFCLFASQMVEGVCVL